MDVIGSMADIRKRFEIPNDNNRWDNPLFKVNMNPVTEVVEGKVEVASTDVEVTPATTTSTSSTAAAAATGVSKMKTSWKPKSKAKDSVAVETTAVPETVFHKTTITTETETSQQATPSSSSSSNTPATAAALSFSGSMVAAVDDITSFQSAQAVLEDVFHHLSSSVTIIPNCSTVTPLHASADLLYELDRTSQKILQLIIQHQIDQVEGTPIQLLEYERALTLHRHISLSELQRFRRQYVKMNAQHPPSSSKLIGASFVDFLASQI